MSFSGPTKAALLSGHITIDRSLLMAMLGLIVIGLVLSFAASPAVALKKGFDTYYFVDQPHGFCWDRMCVDAGFVVSVAFRRQAVCGAPSGSGPCRYGSGSGLRRRNEWRAALAVTRRLLAATFGVRQTGICCCYGLAVCRSGPSP